MSENNAIKFNFDEAVLARSAACKKGMSCLEQGPSCRIGAILNREILVVDCKEMNTSCPFFQAQNTIDESESRGLCTCRVRHALWEKHGL